VREQASEVAEAVSEGVEAIPTPAEAVQGAADGAADAIRGAGQVHMFLQRAASDLQGNCTTWCILKAVMAHIRRPGLAIYVQYETPVHLPPSARWSFECHDVDVNSLACRLPARRPMSQRTCRRRRRVLRRTCSATRSRSHQRCTYHLDQLCFAPTGCRPGVRCRGGPAGGGGGCCVGPAAQRAAGGAATAGRPKRGGRPGSGPRGRGSARCRERAEGCAPRHSCCHTATALSIYISRTLQLRRSAPRKMCGRVSCHLFFPVRTKVLVLSRCNHTEYTYQQGFAAEAQRAAGMVRKGERPSRRFRS